MSFFQNAFDSFSEVVSKNVPNSSNNDLSGGASLPANDAFLGQNVTVGDDNYFVEAGLAAGGFAVVYKVRSSRNESLAMKRLVVNSENKKSVIQEVALVKKLSGITSNVTKLEKVLNS